MNRTVDQTSTREPVNRRKRHPDVAFAMPSRCQATLGRVHIAALGLKSVVNHRWERQCKRFSPAIGVACHHRLTIRNRYVRGKGRPRQMCERGYPIC